MARWSAASPGKGGGGMSCRCDRGGEDCRNQTQDGDCRNRRRSNKSARMDQFLTQAALINGILVFGRSWCRGPLGSRLGNGRKLGVDMGLNRQALDKKSKKREDTHPLTSGGRSGNGLSLTRHRRLF